MLIKIGNRIVNTDLITIAQYEPAGSRQGLTADWLRLYFSDEPAPQEPQNIFTNEEANELWAALTKATENQ